MSVDINGARLNVEVLGPADGPVLIAHHGGGGIGSLAEPKTTFGASRRTRTSVGPPTSTVCGSGPARSRWSWPVALTAASSLWSAVRYPQRVRALVLRDTAADAGTPTLAYDNARRQARVELPWADFDRYWTGRITDDEDLKARWAEMIPLYDYEYDAARSAAAVEAGSYATRRTTGASSTTRPATT